AQTVEREGEPEISEIEATRNPRRNDVYRDVGSEMHDALDPDFIDLHELPFEPDAALLICSDGLTDLVDSTTIREVATQFAGRPQEVVRVLIQEANDAGGKDNVTVVYVEGEDFEVNARRAETRRPVTARAAEDEATRDTRSRVVAEPEPEAVSRGPWRTLRRVALIVLILAVLGYATLRFGPRNPFELPRALAPIPTLDGQIVVTPSQSIAAALASAPAGGTVTVEPREYRERLMLTDGARVVSRIPRGATIRLPSTASEGDPAVVADGVSGAELVGFRIVGDAATPLGTGILAKKSDLSVVDVEITGAALCAVDLRDAARLARLASHIHDNPGAALAIRGGASPRVNQNIFSRNGTSANRPSALI